MGALAATQRRTFAFVPQASAVLVEARSSVGPISFGSTDVSGHISATMLGTDIDLDQPLEASLSLPVDSLVSGNQLYDAEIRSRLNSQRFPTIVANLRSVTAIASDRFSVTGDLTIHGTTSQETGTVNVAVTALAAAEPASSSPGSGGITVVITGSRRVDIRDFDIELPSVLMLQIYPDVTVRFRLTASSDDHS